MKKDRINTSSIREIKHSFKRFLSLLVMSMLGVLVFVGLKMAAPDMMKSLDKYYDDNNFYDIKIVSTLGLTNDDIKGMSKHDLALARNEIYARHGRKFQTEEYSKYFSSKSWYSINPNYNYSDDDSNLNSIEVKNVQFILNAERN